MTTTGRGARRMWWREVVDSWPCDTCGAGPGDPCVSTSGLVKWEPHAARSRTAHDHGWKFPEDD